MGRTPIQGPNLFEALDCRTRIVRTRGDRTHHMFGFFLLEFLKLLTESLPQNLNPRPLHLRSRDKTRIAAVVSTELRLLLT